MQIPSLGIILNGDIQLLYLDVSLTLGESALSLSVLGIPNSAITMRIWRGNFASNVWMPLGFLEPCLMHDASCCSFSPLVLVNSSNPFGQISAAQIPTERLDWYAVIANEQLIFKVCSGGARKAWWKHSLHLCKWDLTMGLVRSQRFSQLCTTN